MSQQRKNIVAVYLRVSSKQQDIASQLPGIAAWLSANPADSVFWFRDVFTGRTLNRPGWQALADQIERGRISRLVVYRLDRLGRDLTGLGEVFELLRNHSVELVSVSEGIIDLTSAAGRLLANVLASSAAYENEVRSERQAAGISLAKQRGVYRGRQPGTLKAEPERARELRESGLTYGQIANEMNVSMSSVRRYLGVVPR